MTNTSHGPPLPNFSVDFLDRFEILGVLGKGGMGTVFKARQKKLDRLVSIKLVHLVDPEMLDRFRQEGQLLAQLHHPRIIAVHDLDVDRNLPYLVCEYVEGQSLREILDDRRRLPVKEALRIVVQMLEGLQAAHERDIIHRDIKPENILVTPAGDVKIADFGLARSSKLDLRRTSSGMLMGTPCYISPEQIEGRALDAKADIYSTGVVLYEMLTGEAPYSGNGPLEILNKHVQSPIPRPSIHPESGDVPRSLDLVVEMAMAKAPASRFPSAEAFRRRIEAILEPLETPLLTVPGSSSNDTTRVSRATGQERQLTRQSLPSGQAFRPDRPGVTGVRRLHAAMALMVVASLLGIFLVRSPRSDPQEAQGSPAGTPGPVAAPRVSPAHAMEARGLVAAARNKVIDGPQSATGAGGPTVADLVRRALELDPDVPLLPLISAMEAKAKDFEAVGRLHMARRQWQAIDDMAPTHPEARSRIADADAALQDRRGWLGLRLDPPGPYLLGDPVRLEVFVDRAGVLSLYVIEPDGALHELVSPHTGQLPGGQVAAGTTIRWPDPLKQVRGADRMKLDQLGPHRYVAILTSGVVPRRPSHPPRGAFEPIKTALEKYVRGLGADLVSHVSLDIEVFSAPNATPR